MVRCASKLAEYTDCPRGIVAVLGSDPFKFGRGAALARHYPTLARARFTVA